MFFSIRIQQASKVPEECVRLNRSLVRNRTLDISDIDALTQLPVSSISTSLLPISYKIRPGHNPFQQNRPSVPACRLPQLTRNSTLLSVLWYLFLRAPSAHFVSLGPT